MVRKKVEEIVGMNLSLKLICPSHGAIWRSHIDEIIARYRQWDNDYQERQITLIYDTMWQATRWMAEAMAEGIQLFDPTIKVQLMNASHDDKNDILLEVFRSKAILVGSPTVNMGITYAIAGMLEMMHGMRFKKKQAAAFGSIGWGGGGERRIEERLQEAGFELAAEALKVKWAPDSETRKQCIEYGKAFAEKVF